MPTGYRDARRSRPRRRGPVGPAPAAVLFPRAIPVLRPLLGGTAIHGWPCIGRSCGLSLRRLSRAGKEGGCDRRRSGATADLELANRQLIPWRIGSAQLQRRSHQNPHGSRAPSAALACTLPLACGRYDWQNSWRKQQRSDWGVTISCAYPVRYFTSAQQVTHRITHIRDRLAVGGGESPRWFRLYRGMWGRFAPVAGW